MNTNQICDRCGGDIRQSTLGTPGDPFWVHCDINDWRTAPHNAIPAGGAK